MVGVVVTMRPRVASAFVLASVLALAPLPAAAEEATTALQRPVSLGVRALGRLSDYELAGVGGQLRLHLHPRVSLELFSDHLLGRGDGVVRHDHEVGGNVQLNVLRGHGWSIHPLLGACALLAVAHAPQSEAVVNDIRFGVRAGIGGEWALGRSVSLQAQAQAVVWLGHDFDVAGWTADTRDTLSLRPAAQAVVAANYWF